jgi:HlyD family secretion protein
MRITKQRLALILFALALLGALVYAFLPQPTSVEIAVIRRGPLQVTVDHEGRTRIKERYVVSAPLSGRLLRVELHPGDPIKAHETILASIAPADPALLDPRARAEAEARVKAAEAAQRRAQPDLERARAGDQMARSDLERAQQLRGSGAISNQEFEAAQLKAHTAAEELKSAEFALQIANFELEQARAVLNPGEQLDGHARFEIRSPVNGEVLRVFQESESFVQPGTQLVEVGDPRDLEMEIDVLSTDAVKIKPGDKVIVEHWGGPAPLLGRVRVVEPAAFLKVSALGVEEQRVNVIADFVSPPEKRASLGDAYRIEVRIVISEAENGLKVPAAALFREGEHWAVFVAEGSRARLRIVEIGRRNDLEAEVLKGLREGDNVITYPGDRLRDGLRIQAARK